MRTGRHGSSSVDGALAVAVHGGVCGRRAGCTRPVRSSAPPRCGCRSRGERLGGEHLGGRPAGADRAAAQQHQRGRRRRRPGRGRAGRRRPRRRGRRPGRGPGRGSRPGSAGRGRWSARRAAGRRCPGRGSVASQTRCSSPPDSSSTPRSAMASTPVTRMAQAIARGPSASFCRQRAAVRVAAVADDVAHADARWASAGTGTAA